MSHVSCSSFKTIERVERRLGSTILIASASLFPFSLFDLIIKIGCHTITIDKSKKQYKRDVYRKLGKASTTRYYNLKYDHQTCWVITETQDQP